MGLSGKRREAESIGGEIGVGVELGGVGVVIPPFFCAWNFFSCDGSDVSEVAASSARRGEYLLTRPRGLDRSLRQFVHRRNSDATD